MNLLGRREECARMDTLLKAMREGSFGGSGGSGGALRAFLGRL